MIFGEEDSQSPQNPQRPQQKQIRLDATGMDTVYANSFALGSSAEEITIYLGVSAPLPGVQQPVVKISHRLMLIPQHAKRLMLALQHTIRAFEDRFGPIELPPPPQQPGGSHSGP